MKETFKKYGRHLGSFAAVLGVLAIPLAVKAAGWQAPLTSVATKGNLGTTPSLTTIIGSIIGTIMAILGVLLVIYILYAGFLWMTAAGKEDNIKKAKQIIYQSIIGLLIVFAAYAITTFVMTSVESISGGNIAPVN